MMRCARASASSTSKPISRSMAATTLLPLAMPPVRPSRNTGRLPGPSGRRSAFGSALAAAEAGSFDGVAHEHGDGHWPNAAGDRRKRASDVQGVGVNIADEHGSFLMEFCEAGREVAEESLGLRGVDDSVGADIDDSGARTNPVGLDIAGFPHGGDQNVSAADDVGEVARFGVANGDGRVGVHEEQGHGLADDVAAAEDDRIGAFDLNLVAAKNFHAA